MNTTVPKIGGIAQMTALGLSAAELARKIAAFRSRTIEGLSQECHADAEQWGEFLYETPECWRVAFTDSGEILGFWQLLPLTKSAFDQAQAGQLYASIITREMVPPLSTDSWNYGYFLSLSICPTLRKSMWGLKFFGTMADSLANLAEKGIFFREFCACFASEYSFELNRAYLQFEYTADHAQIGQVFKTDVLTMIQRRVFQIAVGANVQRLCRLYENAAEAAAWKIA